MKTLLILASLITTSLSAAPRNNNSGYRYSVCDAFVHQNVSDYDWRLHEDDYHSTRILSAKRTVQNGRVYFNYSVISGYNINQPSSQNSTYQVVIQEADDCNRPGQMFCSKLFCRIGKMTEVRKRR